MVPQAKSAACHQGLGAHREAKAGGFWSYVSGAAYKMTVEHIVGGLRIDNHRTTLPFKKGLSSSAAICVAVRPVSSSGKPRMLLDKRPAICQGHSNHLGKIGVVVPEISALASLKAFHGVGQVARAFNVAYGLQLSTRGEMEYAYQAERLTPSLCGRMVH